MKLENYLVDQETKNNVMYNMWCADVKFFGFDSKDSGIHYGQMSLSKKLN